MTKTKKEQIQTIKLYWNECERLLNNMTWSFYGDELLKLCREESKRHDRYRAEHIKRGLTITEESKFFALSRLSAYVYDLEKEPSLRGYHYCQKSIYLAYSLAKEYNDRLKEVLPLDIAQEISSYDYCQLIEVN